MRDINDAYMPTLLQACGLQTGDSLPEGVVEKFWEYKRIKDRVGPSMFQDFELHLICLLGGAAAPKPELDNVPLTFLELVETRRVNHGSPIVVTWRGEERLGTFLSITSRNQVKCILDNDDGKEREVSPKNVKLPQLVEA
jgi:hypothetical protein